MRRSLPLLGWVAVLPFIGPTSSVTVRPARRRLGARVIRSGIGKAATWLHTRRRAEEAREALLHEGRVTLGLLERALASLEPFGAVGELRAEHAAVAHELAREEIVVEVVGAQARAALETLLGLELFAPAGATAPLVLRARTGDRLAYRARLADGSEETVPPDHSGTLQAAVAAAEREVAAATEELQALAERLQDQGRMAVRARAQLAAAEQERALCRVQASEAPVPAPPPPAAAPAKPPAERRGWLARLMAFLVGLVIPSRRRAKALPALPAPEKPPERSAPPLALPPVRRERRHSDPWVEATKVGVHEDDEALADASPAERLAAAERRVDGDTRLVAMVDREVERLEGALRAGKARAGELNAERERRRRALAAYRSDLRSRTIERLLELTGAAGPRAVELELSAPEVPAHVVLVVALAGAPSPSAVDGRLTVEETRARDALLRQIEALWRAHPATGARRLVRALAHTREAIFATERSAREACDARRAELDGCRVVDREAMLRERRSLARQAVAKASDQIVHKAADTLEELVGQVRNDWEAQIAGSAGLEQLRAQVTGIENAAPHRLSIVCDDVRESMILQSVRLVLELMQPLRQELLRKRLAVAEGRSPKADETFQNIRVALPGQVDATLSALRAPDLGALANPERGLLASLFHTLAREKRQCSDRLAARLDDMKRTTVRELFASAVYLSPLLLATFEGLAEELLWAHERWIVDRVAEAEAERQDALRRLAPALELRVPLESGETSLRERIDALEAASATAA